MTALSFTTPASPAADRVPEASRPALILVVDDEPQIVEFLSVLLEEEGYRVCQAYDGRQALRAIQEEAPQLVISDVMMPLSGGLDLVRQIDATEYMPPPKVILMSAVSERAPRDDVPFIQKPFDIEEMLAMVDGALEMRRSA